MSVILNPFQLLELNLISAQDLAPVARSMRTYAVAWVHPDRRLSTRVDANGRNSPTWNDKFVFRIDEDFLKCDTSAIVIEIYAVHWLKDLPVGTVRVLVNNFVPPPPSRPFREQRHAEMQFVALQVRRPSGRPQGILNVGIAVLDSSMRSMPLYSHISSSAIGFPDLLDKKTQQEERKQQQVLPVVVAKRELRRTKSDSSSMVGANAKPLKRKVSSREKADSVVNASEVGSSYQLLKKIPGGPDSKPSSLVNGSEIGRGRKKNDRPRSKLGGESRFITESELGPSPSEVAADLAAKEKLRIDQDAESSVLAWSLNNESVEGLQSKLERWRAELPAIYDQGEPSGAPSVNKRSDREARRHTDGGAAEGLFSCFSNICGCECSISCGNPAKKKSNSRRRQRSHSPETASYV